MNRNEFKRDYNNVAEEVEAIMQKPVLTGSQKKMADISSLLAEVPKLKDEKRDENPDTADMPELESEESAEQKGVGLKILTTDQMLSRLPITLAQLKAGNNSEKLKNEISHLLYSLYRQKWKQPL